MNASLLLYVHIYKHWTYGPNSEGDLHASITSGIPTEQEVFSKDVCVQQLAQHLTNPTEKAAAKMIDKTELNYGNTEVIDIVDWRMLKCGWSYSSLTCN